MEKFNLNNLSSYDFELLSRDIMKKMLGLNSKLYTFSSGKDGGIDICSPEISNPKVMIQARHYIGSKFSDLANKMNKEKKKVQKKNPKNYYLITSCKFSNPEQKKKIIKKINEQEEITKRKEKIIKIIGENFMKDISHIISYEDINRFLDDSKNISILKKHYKLWLFSTNVFELIQNRDILFDEEMFMSEIEEESQKFVKTDFYEKTLKILNKENLVIITGNPGTGKSILSKMLILNYTKKGYKVKISNTNNISKIKQSLSPNKKERQLILLDNFLGQYYLELNNKKLEEVYSTVKYIKKKYKNTKIILNSRTTVLNEVKEKENYFIIKETKERNKEILVDTNKISYLDKAKILYNYLYFSELGNDFFEEIKRDKNYFKIIKHKNYNPRIIEHMIASNEFEKPKEYIKEFLKNLDNPSKIWKNQFKEMKEEDRVFLFTLYSLTSYSIEEKILKEAVNKRLVARKKDTTINFFENSLNKLINSLITKNQSKTLISVLDPLVNDFLKNELKNNLIECSDIIKNSIYIEQILNILRFEEAKNSIEIKEHINELLKTKKFFKLKSVYYDIKEEYLKKVIEYEVKSKKIEKEVKKIFINNIDGEYLFNKLLEKKFLNFYKFYDLKKEFLKLVKKEQKEFKRFLWDDIELEEFIQILNFLKEEKINIEFINIKDIMLSHIKNKLEEKIEIYIEEERDDISDFLDKIYNYNWSNKELKKILEDEKVQIYLEKQEEEIILKIQDDLEKIKKDNKEIEELISYDNYKNIGILILDFQEECIKNLIEDINSNFGIEISKDEIEKSIEFCYDLFKDYDIEKKEIKTFYYENFEILKKLDQSKLEDIFEFFYLIFRKNQKFKISRKFLENKIQIYNITFEEFKYLKLIIENFNIIFEKKDRKKIEINSLKKNMIKCFKKDFINEREKKKL